MCFTYTTGECISHKDTGVQELYASTLKGHFPCGLVVKTELALQQALVQSLDREVKIPHVTESNKHQREEQQRLSRENANRPGGGRS